jgi:hypothetical protein
MEGSSSVWALYLLFRDRGIITFVSPLEGGGTVKCGLECYFLSYPGRLTYVHRLSSISSIKRLVCAAAYDVAR